VRYLTVFRNAVVLADALASSASGTGDGSFMTTLIAEAIIADEIDMLNVLRGTTAALQLHVQARVPTHAVTNIRTA